jgi:hypothetical protein
MTTADTLPLPPLPETPKKRRRWIGWAIAAGVLVVVLVVGAFVAESVARGVATDRIHDELVTGLSLEADHPMDIDLGGGSLIVQALGGTVDSVDIAIDDVPLGDIVGDVVLAATGIPIDMDQPVATVDATVTVDAANVQKLAGSVEGIALDSVTLGDGVIEVAATLEALVFSIPVSATVAPSAEAGQLVLAPQSISINGTATSVDELRDGPLGSLAGGLFGQRSICVAQYLPAILTLEGVDVTETAVVLDFSGDGAVLGADDLAAKGTCG